MSRKVESRRVIADERRPRQAATEAEGQAKLDDICDWASLKEHCQNLELHFSETESGITLFSLSNNQPPVVQFSTVISSYIVNCFVKNTRVSVNHLINTFTTKLENMSQLRDIISFMQNDAQPETKQKLKAVAEEVQTLIEILNVGDDEKYFRLVILKRQLNLNSYEKNDFKVTIDLFLRRRDAYKGMREKFVLPRPRRIKSLFGVMDSVGSLQECWETASAVFQRYDGVPKCCKILIDEVHIKPAIRSQGNHLIGYSVDWSDKPARAMLALMVCPIMGEGSLHGTYPCII